MSIAVMNQNAGEHSGDFISDLITFMMICAVTTDVVSMPVAVVVDASMIGLDVRPRGVPAKQDVKAKNFDEHIARGDKD